MRHRRPSLATTLRAGAQRLQHDVAEVLQPAVEALIAAADGKRITLIYAARDTKVNHAAVLMRYLQQT